MKLLLLIMICGSHRSADIVGSKYKAALDIAQMNEISSGIRDKDERYRGELYEVESSTSGLKVLREIKIPEIKFK